MCSLQHSHNRIFTSSYFTITSSILMFSQLDSGLSGLGLILTEDIVLCSWTRHFTLTVPLSTQLYKWVTTNLMQEVILWKTCFKVSTENFRHYFTWYYWLRKFPIDFQPVIIQNHNVHGIICIGVTHFMLMLHFLHWCYTWTVLLSPNQNWVLFSRHIISPLSVLCWHNYDTFIIGFYFMTDSDWSAALVNWWMDGKLPRTLLLKYFWMKRYFRAEIW